MQYVPVIIRIFRSSISFVMNMVFVIDEADNESHGTADIYQRDTSWENRSQCWNRLIADNPEFIDATLDRIQSCVHRDKTVRV